ncbi:DUF294 nucleotidyltransferase-like domain-containing protein [Prosthecobacter sp.]|uniref:DUF294 nucleotidyltransferase-like domain-containing protein n=1 Tax=Prosthecobacter sp. TaxID=1965333 RepID=UPI003782EB61
MTICEETSPSIFEWDHAENWLKGRSFEIFKKADKFSCDLLEKCRLCVDEYLAKAGINQVNVCIVIIGSVGRREALEASDLDIIPVLADDETAKLFEPHDQPLRKKLGETLGIKVSKGEDLTKFTALSELIQDDSIGGENDGSGALTKRILILSESAQAGGGLLLGHVREKILTAYAGKERTSGSHVLSLCNDLARYYRTLCIEYKAKIDVEAKDWATRNMKLRHSRKVWYFTTMFSMVMLAERCPRGKNEFQEALLKAFELSPCLRMAELVVGRERSKLSAARILECYSIFLEFMSDNGRRQGLAKVSFVERYKVDSANLFLALKFNSDLLHTHILTLIESLDIEARHRILDWFLF